MVKHVAKTYTNCIQLYADCSQCFGDKIITKGDKYGLGLIGYWMGIVNLRGSIQ